LAVDSYRQVAAGAAVDGRVHEAWLIVSVSGLAGLSGLGTIKARDAIRRETRLLAGRLRSAELSTEGAVDASAISEIFEAAHAEDGGSRGVVPVRHWRPMADEDHWSVYRAGGTWHATYWIAEWPRIDVGPEFMSPLLLGGRRRTVSMTMSPIPPDRAAREARSARTSDLADERLRSQAGFLPSARRDRVADGAARREAELADGHVDYRFSGYVTVTSVSRSELDAACAETEQAALSARLEIRRLYGRQREAFTWTLPIGRGLR
jgi:hypothetical protein